LQVKSTSGKDKKNFWEQVKDDGEAGSSADAAEEEKHEFVGEPAVRFPVVMLDMSGRRTFKPLGVLQEEAKRL
jgi:hypothetical protein